MSRLGNLQIVSKGLDLTRPQRIRLLDVGGKGLYVRTGCRRLRARIGVT